MIATLYRLLFKFYSKQQMNFDNLNIELQTGNLKLRPISAKDGGFITELFQDRSIRKFYIVPKEARQDYRYLLNYWIQDVHNGAGNCWIISIKSQGFFSKDTSCGFIAFEFRDTLKNARISYALHPKFRGQGIATNSVKVLISLLEENGVERIEADIDRDNLDSERVVEKLGFTANKSQALVDPEMFREGELRMRALWKKELKELSTNKVNRIATNATREEIIPQLNKTIKEIEANGQHPKLLSHYYYLLGRIKYLERDFEASTQAFGQCNMILEEYGLKDNFETYYWFGKINEAKGEKGSAKMYYGFALENYYDNSELISKQEILEAINN